MGFFEAAKAFVTDPENIARAKALATDQNVDLAAAKLKEFAPEPARGALDGLAEKAKEWGGPEDEEPAVASSEEKVSGETPGSAGDPGGDDEPAGNGDARNGDGHEGENRRTDDEAVQRAEG